MNNEQKLQRQLEQKIIGSILTLDTTEEQMQALFELGGEKYISSADYRKILHGISHLVIKERMKVDQINLFAYLKNYAVEISKATIGIVSVAYLEQDIKILKMLNYKKALIIDLKKALDNLTEAQSLSEIESAKNNFILNLSSKSFGNESVMMNYEKLEELLMSNLSKKRAEKIDGYSFGISDLDKITNGIITSKLYTIGALKKSGKTRFIIHLIKELLKQKVSTAFISLEVPEYEVYKMLKASALGIEDTQLRTGNLNHLSKDQIKDLEDIKFSSQNLMIECSTGLYLSDILRRLRKYSQLGAKVIFIDFFQRIVHDIKNKVNELEEIAQRLADATREYNVAVFMLSQLSNLAEKEIPSISHLKGTGALAEASDTIMIFDYVPRRTGNTNDLNRMDLDITQRYGESGKLSIYADLGRCAFNNYSKNIK
jgi:replicative DNA helicase